MERGWKGIEPIPMIVSERVFPVFRHRRYLLNANETVMNPLESFQTFVVLGQ